MVEMHFSLKRLEPAPVRDRISAWTDSGCDAGWQLFCSAVKCLCTKESRWDKQVSSGNALPPAKPILHFDEIHDSISVLQTCFFPTEYDVFSKPYTTVILPAWREKYPEISVTLKESETETLLGGDLSIQGDASCKGRQLVFMPPQSLCSN